MRNRLLCLVCVALLPAFSFAQQKAPPAGGGPDQPLIPSICEGIDANLLRGFNCGFERGDFSSWTLHGPTDFTFVSGGFANSGSFGAAFGPIGDFDNLSTSIFISGTYHVEFWLANVVGGTGTYFQADLGDQTLMAMTDSDPFPYTLFTFGPIPANDGDNLAFIFRHDPDFWSFDDVDLEFQSSRPEQDE
jgi:hypothetical protein